MGRARTSSLTVGYAVVAYAAFLVASAWAVTFLADLQLPRGIDRGAQQPVGVAVVVDVALLLLFALQHSVMARAGFKHWVARWIPAHVERSTYVLATSLVLLLLLWQWQPVGTPTWDLHGVAGGAIWVLYALGWLIALGSTFMVDHLDVFGVRRAYLHARRSASPAGSISRALAVRLGSPPVDARLVGGLLGDPAHDGWAPALRGGRHRLHLGRRAVRGGTTSSTSWATSTATTPVEFPPSSRCADQPSRVEREATFARDALMVEDPSSPSPSPCIRLASLARPDSEG